MKNPRRETTIFVRCPARDYCKEKCAHKKKHIFLFGCCDVDIQSCPVCKPVMLKKGDLKNYEKTKTKTRY